MDGFFYVSPRCYVPEHARLVQRYKISNFFFKKIAVKILMYIHNLTYIYSKTLTSIRPNAFYLNFTYMCTLNTFITLINFVHSESVKFTIHRKGNLKKVTFQIVHHPICIIFYNENYNMLVFRESLNRVGHRHLVT